MSFFKPDEQLGGTASPRAAALFLTISSACWGGNIFIGRLVHAEVPPVGLSFWRWVLALAILLPFAWPRLRRDWPEVRRHWRALAALARFEAFRLARSGGGSGAE